MGVVGASAERGWASATHLPALAAAPEYEVTAVASSSPGKAAAAARLWQARHAFADARQLIDSPEVDLVVLAVPVPRREGLVDATIAAGKHVYCEWPLAMDAGTAAGFRDAADAAGVRHVIGLQSRHHPAVRQVRARVEDRWIGEPLSATFTYSLSTPDKWPARYKQYIEQGATNRLIIVGGHALDVFRRAVGDFTSLSATTATRLPEAELAETGEKVPVGWPDQISVTGVLGSGAVASAHIITGGPFGTGYRIEVHGTKGRLVLLSESDELVGTRWRLLGALGRAELEPLPDSHADDLIDAPPAVRNVNRVYRDLASAIADGTPVEPDFATATDVHRLLDTIVSASDSGERLDYRCGNRGTGR
ncbi:putative dehydrogenase [Lentzea aerocolonigenes]|nr:putative dehydrogenase [Lentzea aerocolonigenes]